MLICLPHLAAVARTFHRQRNDVNEFLRSNDSISRTNYFRIFALASIDIALTLPIGIANIVLASAESVAQARHLPFYEGWAFVHTDWEPVSFSYEGLLEAGTSTVAEVYFSQWTSPVLACVIFGLFGVTKEARASYMRAIRTVLGWFGWTPAFLSDTAHPSLHAMEFGEPPQNASIDPDTG